MLPGTRAQQGARAGVQAAHRRTATVARATAAEAAAGAAARSSSLGPAASMCGGWALSGARHTGPSSGARLDGLEEFKWAFARQVPSDHQLPCRGAGARTAPAMDRATVGAERDPTCCVYPYLTLPYLTHPPSQHRTNPHDAVPDALSPVRGPLGDTITSHPSTHAWRAADAGRVPKRVRIVQPDLLVRPGGGSPGSEPRERTWWGSSVA